MSMPTAASLSRTARAWLFVCLCLCLCLLPAAEADDAEEIRAAVRFAYGLEAAVWRDPTRFRTRAEIYEHFRQGFSPDLAHAMTEHVLASDGEPATWVPEQVHVVERLPNYALVWFPTPPAFGEGGLWDLKPYMQLRLRRDGERWVVVEGEDRSAPPVR